MSNAANTRLNSWKEIAIYLCIDVRTARRWTEDRGLPVHRIPGKGRRAVHAYTHELEEWLRSDRGPEPKGNEPPPGQDDAGASAEPPVHGGARWTRRNPAIMLEIVAFGLVVLLVSRVPRLLPGFVTHGSRVTRIDSVSPIHAEAAQTVVISGRGFGPRPRTIRMDASGAVDTLAGNNQTSLVVANRGEGAHRWSAGRASEVNTCEISVRLENWSDSQIVLSGFSGPIGTGCGEKYQLAAGDSLEIGVFGPLNRCGPGGIPNCPGEVQNGHVGSNPNSGSSACLC